MSNYKDILATTELNDYKRQFVNAMHLKSNDVANYRDGYNAVEGAYYVPADSEKALRNAIADKGVIRTLSTTLTNYDGGAKIWVAESEDRFAFVPEGGSLPGFDVMDDFTRFAVERHKLAGLVKLTSEFAYDVNFDIEKYLRNRMAKSFALAEDAVFVSGTGISEPFGLLHETEGAEIGVTTAELSYDDCIDLFFSVKPEYRSEAVWLMNDRTALTLCKLKDDDGNYLWNSASDTILGRPVRICNEMPDIAPGAKPVLFGDLGYYWIVDRSPISIKTLKERFAMNDQIGYVGFEFLDARLVRADAVKALAVSAE